MNTKMKKKPEKVRTLASAEPCSGVVSTHKSHMWTLFSKRKKHQLFHPLNLHCCFSFSCSEQRRFRSFTRLLLPWNTARHHRKGKKKLNAVLSEEERMMRHWLMRVWLCVWMMRMNVNNLKNGMNENLLRER